MKRWLPCLLALVCATAGAVDYQCGKRAPKNVSITDITLTGPTPDEGLTPVFYDYAADSRFRIFARPQDVLKSIDDLITETEAISGAFHALPYRALAEQISKDLPLVDHTDLGKYALRDPASEVTMQYVIAHLLLRGRASVGSSEYFHGGERRGLGEPATIRMYQLGEDGSPWSRRFCNGTRTIYGMRYQIE